MRKVPFFKQDTDYSCGAAALQMVFGFHHKVVSEKELIKELRSAKDVGTSHSALITRAKQEGFFVYTNNQSSLEEIAFFIKQELPVIVHFIEPSGNEGHYAVVININNDHITLNDPWNGEGFIMTRQAFEERWESSDHKNKKWLMIISPHDLGLGYQYHPALQR